MVEKSLNIHTVTHWLKEINMQHFYQECIYLIIRICKGGTVWKFQDFLSFRFYVKSILGIIHTSSKIALSCSFRGSEFGFLWIFALFEGYNIPHKQNSEHLKWQTRAVLQLLDLPKLISRKIWAIRQYHQISSLLYSINQKFLPISKTKQKMTLICKATDFLGQI